MLGIKNSHFFVSAGVRKKESSELSELKHNRGRRHSLSADINSLVEETVSDDYQLSITELHDP